jgi:hypothetical protein
MQKLNTEFAKLMSQPAFQKLVLKDAEDYREGRTDDDVLTRAFDEIYPAWMTSLERRGAFDGDKLIVYRGLGVKNPTDIDLRNPGVYWTWDKAKAKNYSGKNTQLPLTIVTASVSPDDIDLKETLRKIVWPGYSNDESECEITLKPSRKLGVKTVGAFKKKVLSHYIQAVARPRKFWRGTEPGRTERIRTGNAGWDSYLFAADAPEKAKWYGSQLTVLEAKPEAKILYEGTRDFQKVAAGCPHKNMLGWAAYVAEQAKARGYDAVWFKRQTDIGTAIINPAAFTKEEATAGVESPVTEVLHQVQKWVGSDITETSKLEAAMKKLPPELLEQFTEIEYGTVLYRGMNFSAKKWNAVKKQLGKKELKIGGSWSKSKELADSFALGSLGPYGVVVSKEPDQSDVIVNVDAVQKYIRDQKLKGYEDFLEQGEQEFVLKPQTNYQIESMWADGLNYQR